VVKALQTVALRVARVLSGSW